MIRHRPRSRFVAQHGDGWDERQANILAWGHEQGYERTVLIGSDSPQLPFTVVSDAFAALLDHDVAMGRTLDGGYYLIGMRGFHDVLSRSPDEHGHRRRSPRRARPGISGCGWPSCRSPSTSTRSGTWSICGARWLPTARAPRRPGRRCDRLGLAGWQVAVKVDDWLSSPWRETLSDGQTW